MNYPTWGVKGFTRAVKNRFTVNVSVHQIRRARKKALTQALDEHSSQYDRLRDHCTIIVAKNPGLVAIVNVIDRPQIFERMFLMFSAQKEGLLNDCRPVIGLDACHLKGPFGGQLMCAVGRDANNQMFPIAFAAFEAECKASGIWLLDVLMYHIGKPDEKGWVFISYRQKVS